MAKFIAVVVMGYLLGSIPFGVLIGRRMAGVDIRQYGSGKIGTTNVLRTVGKKAAVIAAGLDVLKGVLAVILAGLIVGQGSFLIGDFSLSISRAAPVLAALAAIVGHIWPVFLRFRGGRGVATFFGGLLALCWQVAIFSGVVMIIMAGLTRYASVGSISGAVSAFIILVLLAIFSGFPTEYIAYALIGATLIIITHRDNITRLIAGTERKIGQRV